QAEETAAPAGHIWSIELKEANCKICQDSGWVLVKVGEREIARPCQCRQSDTKNNLFLNANIPLRFLNVDLRGYKPEKEGTSQAKAKQAAEKFITDYPNVEDYGLLFQGGTGVGKTRLLCCIGNQLIKEKNIDVVYIDWNDLAREMRSGEDTSNRDFSTIGQLIQRLAMVELLIFDELGSSKPSPWVEDNIYYLINRRYNNKRITLFASNYFDKKLGSEDTLRERIGERIRSRLFEMAHSFEILGVDYRQRYLTKENK
ncbi:MAG: ATP-binding protein, partial [Candidatus Aminicenantes bacterium]|nr:ATP-binding protein [Candidatus Aminicenantes bacterium]